MIMARGASNLRACACACALAAGALAAGACAGAEASDAVIAATGVEGSAADVAQSSTHFRLAPWPRRGQQPDFRLVDADGRPRKLADYRGRVVVVLFGFVHCPDVCPAELFKLSVVMKKLGLTSDRVQVLFVTLDPERDTRTVLKGYVGAFDPRFVGLTGSTAEVAAAAEHFFVEYAKVGDGADYTIDHSTSTFVLDARGRLRLVGAMNASIEDYAHDLAALAAE